MIKVPEMTEDRFIRMREWRPPHTLNLIAKQPLQFMTKDFAAFDSHSGVVFTPYPGWRWVMTPEGYMLHEKIPPLWRRILEYLSRGAIT